MNRLHLRIDITNFPLYIYIGRIVPGEDYDENNETIVIAIDSFFCALRPI